jgi:hypothetical protein
MSSGVSGTGRTPGSDRIRSPAPAAGGGVRYCQRDGGGRGSPGTGRATRGTTILTPAPWTTASTACVKLASPSCSTNLTRVRASSRPMSRFRACRTARGRAGCPVAPGTRTRRLPCSVTASTSPALSGGAHDLAAARTRAIIRQLAVAWLITLADKS